LGPVIACFDFKSGKVRNRARVWDGRYPLFTIQRNPSVAMMDRGFANWLPWAPCFAIGLILALVALKGILTLLHALGVAALPERA
jgi:hypothetical protein